MVPSINIFLLWSRFVIIVRWREREKKSVFEDLNGSINGFVLFFYLLTFCFFRSITSDHRATVFLSPSFLHLRMSKTVVQPFTVYHNVSVFDQICFNVIRFSHREFLLHRSTFRVEKDPFTNLMKSTLRPVNLRHHSSPGQQQAHHHRNTLLRSSIDFVFFFCRNIFWQILVGLILVLSLAAALVIPLVVMYMTKSLIPQIN